MEDKVTGNTVAELRKRAASGSFSEEMMQSVLKDMCNKVEYALKDSRKIASQLEECSNSKLNENVLNGKTFKYHFGWGGRSSYASSVL